VIFQPKIIQTVQPTPIYKKSKIKRKIMMPVFKSIDLKKSNKFHISDSIFEEDKNEETEAKFGNQEILKVLHKKRKIKKNSRSSSSKNLKTIRKFSQNLVKTKPKHEGKLVIISKTIVPSGNTHFDSFVYRIKSR
jgi:hypothetical protein